MQSLQLITWPGLRSERRQEASGQEKNTKSLSEELGPGCI